MELIPVNDKIVVKKQDKKDEGRTASGIILPDSVGDKMFEAEVIAVSEGMYTQTGTKIPPIVEVGDTILYEEMAQSTKDYKLNGEDVIIMSQNEILSIIRK